MAEFKGIQTTFNEVAIQTVMIALRDEDAPDQSLMQQASECHRGRDVADWP